MDAVTWRILVSDGLAASGLRLLQSQAEILQSQSLNSLGSVEAWIVRGRTLVTAEALKQAAPRLRVVGRAGSGVDNVDLQAAQDLNVIVVNAPEASTVAVAELTLGLLLAVARNLAAADATLKKGEWRKAELVGTQLQGKTLGLIGVGRIGSAVARRAHALGMRVLGYDIHLRSELIEQRGAEPASFEELLSQSDFISVHVPFSQETLGMIDSATLSKVKPGAYLINTARGGIVDEQALLAALEQGRLSGAALDVFAQEPPGPHPLLQHPNVIVSPHVGAQTREAQDQAAADIAQEVLAALQGQPLRWRVV